MLLLKAFAIWLVFMIAESLNGTLRILWLVPSLGDRTAHQLSFVTGAILIVAIATLFIRWLHVSRVPQLLGVGVLWIVLTLAFEIALGRFILGYSWGQIAVDYNVYQGGLMPFGLVWLGLSPFIAAKIRGVLPGQNQLA
jgi:hypothetical protein